MTNNRTVNLIVGWTFILLGIVGTVLPVLQGFLFFIVGLLFLSKEYLWAGNLLNWLKKIIHKYIPKAGKVFDNAEAFLDKEVKKMSTEKGYFRKRIWLMVLILLILGFAGWLLALLFGWLKELIFG